MQIFRVRGERDGPRVCVHASGELDIATVPSLEECARAYIQAHAETVELDLREVRFIDSTGIRLLLTLEAEAQRLVGRERAGVAALGAAVPHLRLERRGAVAAPTLARATGLRMTLGDAGLRSAHRRDTGRMGSAALIGRPRRCRASDNGATPHPLELAAHRRQEPFSVLVCPAPQLFDREQPHPPATMHRTWAMT